ncbi:MAG: HNH endonuclease [Thaumarchaeota archaeon]|nr:HNH endonuclease [Nitrososphaerota archaeon]
MNAARRKRYADDPEYRERIQQKNSIPENRERKNRLRRERYADDPEYKARVNATNNKRYANDPEYRNRIKKRQKDRWDNDPEYRERQRAMQTTPEYRERQNKRNRKKYADPEYRDNANKRRRNRYENDSEYRDRILRQARTPEARERKNTTKRKKYADDPEYKYRLLVDNHNRRGAGQVDWRALRIKFDMFGWICLRCGATDNIEIDHITPITKGGTGDIKNLQPLCRPCNLKKGVNQALLAQQ